MKVIEKILPKCSDLEDDTFIFDIETTGLNPKFCEVILIGILYNCQNKTIIKQFFAENEDDEKYILDSFINEIKIFKKHITYNGLTFDLNFINCRLKKHNIDFYLNKEDDFDILRFVKLFKKPLNLENCNLSTIERYFGIYREDIIDGSESVKLYKEFVKTQDSKIMNTILLHNYEDIYNLRKLVNIKDLISNKLDLLCINCNNQSIKVFPLDYKITSKKIHMNYYIFFGEHNNISIYNDKSSIICQENNISLEININKGVDKEENTILFYNLSKIIPLKFNDKILENNIYSLCNFVLKNELSNI